MCQKLLIPRRMGGFSPLSYGSDLALWLDPSYGIYTDRSTQLTAASSQYWSVASNSTLQTGDVDWWWAGWVYPDTLATLGGLVTKGNGSGASSIEYLLYLMTNGSLSLYISDGITATTKNTTAGQIVAGAWSFVFFYYDASTNIATAQVNANAAESTAAMAGIAANSQAVRIGNSGAGEYVNGRMDSWMFGKNPVGGIAALTTTIRDYLYNSGSGRVYADLSSTQKTAWGLISAYDFDGDGLDSHGTNDLTAVNSPTYTSGIASGVAGDGDLVSLIVPRAGSNLTPPSYAGRPTWYANAGKPYLSFDGVNDGLQTASNISLGAFTIANNFYASGTAGIIYEHDASASADSGYLYGTTGNTINIFRGGVQAGRNLTANWAVDSTWRTAAMQYDGTVAGTLLRFNSVNQSLTTTVGGNPGTGTATKVLYIGSRNGGAGLCSTMRLGDFVAINANLSAAQLAQLESWLIARRSA